MDLGYYVYAILSGIFAGLYSFTLKVSAEKNHNALLVTAISLFIGGLSALCFVVGSQRTVEWSWILLGTSVVNGVFYLIASATRVESLKNIDTAIYFPIYKTLAPILMTCLGVFVFAEKLVWNEWCGIVLGIVVPLLLVTKKQNQLQKNLRRGLILLCVGTVFAVISSATAKLVTIFDLDHMMYIAISFIIGGCISCISYKQKEKKKEKELMTQQLLKVAAVSGVFVFLSTYCFIRAAEGSISVAYTINSFSIVVPIILSRFKYAEELGLQKQIAIVITIASLIIIR